MLTCAYLRYSSVAYSGLGSPVGIAVPIVGLPLLFLIRTKHRLPAAK